MTGRKFDIGFVRRTLVTEYDMWMDTESALMEKGDGVYHYDTHEAIGEPWTAQSRVRKPRPCMLEGGCRMMGSNYDIRFCQEDLGDRVRHVDGY